LKRLSYSKID